MNRNKPEIEVEGPLLKPINRKSILKPCPFCGALGVILETQERRYIIACKNCSIRTWDFSIKKMAIQAWNRRAK